MEIILGENYLKNFRQKLLQLKFAQHILDENFVLGANYLMNLRQLSQLDVSLIRSLITLFYHSAYTYSISCHLFSHVSYQLLHVLCHLSHSMCPYTIEIYSIHVRACIHSSSQCQLSLHLIKNKDRVQNEVRLVFSVGHHVVFLKKEGQLQITSFVFPIRIYIFLENLRNGKMIKAEHKRSGST